MVPLITSAILLGIFLSLILIGPVFFLLLETSLTKGVKPAIALEVGVISADLLCIIISHRGSKGLLDFIDAHPSLYMIAGFIIFIYGLYSILSRGNLHLKGGTNIVTTNYFKTFMNGFILNLVNIGVIVFWLTTVVLISAQYPKQSDFYLYMSCLIITMIGVDLLKIFLANKFQNKLTDQIVYRIKKIVGIALLIFGIILFGKSFIKTNSENPFELIENNNPNHKK
ncbi:LysE family translocator [Apibacter adventoris]|uniref:Lysine transporter LysE n=1 Tax=Apibacter adventoris TaxID=1679466 RepID=A0A2S8AGR0_9FLAO|nr:LysE family transporter [Apibacter adventoris]PQL92570.1 lysine transporter LysE [Apibacter adventoris]PQL95575.1 lysine transporter LysE [Apibacter adventoris]